MTVVVLGLALGAVGGLVTGGRLANLATTRLTSLWLLVIGAAGQGLAGLTGLRGLPGLAFVLLSYLALAAFAARNLRLAGMGVLALGVVLNVVPITLDGGMPVEGPAIVRAGIARLDEVPALRFGAKRHLAHPGDHVRVLDDAIPDWITHEVVSVGDLVIGAGVAAVVARLMRRRVSGSRRQGATSSAASPDRPTNG